MADAFDRLFSENGEGENQAEKTTETTEVTVEEAAIDAATETPEVVEEVTASPEPEQVREAPKEVERNRGHNEVPFAVYLEERQKKQEVARQFEEYKAEVARQEALRQAQNIPDPFDNPDEFRQAILREATEAALTQVRQEDAAKQQAALRQNWERAQANHTPEEVHEALEWANQKTAGNTPEDVEWVNTTFASTDPVKAILEQKNAHAQFDDYMRDPEGFFARKAVEMGIAGTPMATPAIATSAAKAAPKSIISTGTSAKSTDRSKGDAFDRLFGK